MITDGILVINKPKNWTSHDCVAVCRRVLGIKKVGHGGTLDPMAQGVLPVFIGRATRIMEYMDLDYKTYRCRVKLGIITDTQDIWGEIIEQRNTENIEEKDIIKALGEFIGEIEQKPPKYSALKVKGRKLYEYARQGIDVEIKPRKVRIKDLSIEKVDMDNMEVLFTVKCSKGTYVRTICHDLGERLGCGGVMSYLERTENGVFHMDMGIDPEQLKSMEHDEIEKYVFPVDYPLVHFKRAELKKDRAVYFISGNSIRWNQVKTGFEEDSQETPEKVPHVKYRVYQKENGKFLGVGYYDEEKKELKADKIFVTRQEI